MKKVGISLAEVYERVGKSVILLFRYVLSPKGLMYAFYNYEKVKRTLWFCDLFIF